MILPVTLYAWLSGNLGDMAVNITEGLHMISVFTYQEGFLISMEVLVLGAVVCAILGTLASTCLKSSYVSLGLCMLCMLAGTALSSYASWMKLFPFKFMELTCVAVRGFTCNLFDQAFYDYIVQNWGQKGLYDIESDVYVTNGRKFLHTSRGLLRYYDGVVEAF